MVEECQNQSEFSPKHIRFEEIRADEDEDQISRLPDSLLVEILSRLPTTKHAIRTGTLSNRWKHVWNSVANLIFTHRDNPSADFVSFVDKTLTQRGQLKLKKLDINTTYNHLFEPQIRNWIRYAISCNAEEIIMTLRNPKHGIRFQLDQCFFINSCFTDLTLRGCIFNPVEAISWKNLKSLCISNAKLDEDLIENILSGSPLLEILVLKECFGFTRLNITSKSVKKLVLYGYTRLNITSKSFRKLVLEGYMYNSNVIEINAPNILSLAIKSYWFMRKLLLINVSSLVEAELNYKQVGYIKVIPKEVKEEILKGFIVNLRHVKEIKIGILCYKVLSHLEAKGLILPSNLKICDDVSSYPLDSDDDSPNAS